MLPLLLSVIIFSIVIFSTYKFKDKWKYYLNIYFALIAIFSVLWSSAYLYRNFQKPHEWDFLCWYLDGSVAAEGLNFYEPASYHKVFHSLTIPYKPSKVFISNIVDVGFKYPPPSMFYLMPLGYLSYKEAHILWVSFNILVILFCLYFLWKIYLPQKNIIAYSLVLIFFFLNKGTRWTLGVEQNTILLLLMLILVWKDANSPRVGLWLALGIIIKPIVAIVLGYLLIKRNWKGSLLTFVFLILLFGSAELFFGSNIFTSYFTKNPNSDVPSLNYIESVNCSLLATILRTTNYDINMHPPLFNPIYLVTGGAIFLISLLLIYLNKNELENWGLAYIIVTGLIIYPATQQFYIILLIPLIFLLYKNFKQLPGKIYTSAFIIALIYGLPQLDSYHIDVYFITHLLIWFLLSIFLIIKSDFFNKHKMRLSI